MRNLTQILTCESAVFLILFAQLPDLDLVVEHGPDLVLGGDELVLEDHLVDVVVEAPDLISQRKLNQL